MNTKLLIGGVVGGLILFIYSFLSWAILDLHSSTTQYTPAQDEIMALLSTKITEDGSYMLPMAPNGASSEEQQKLHDSMGGKPWAMISYHKSFKTGMVMNMARGLFVDIIIAIMALWMIYKMRDINFKSVFTFCLFIGLIAFMFFPYGFSIWFETDTIPDLIDAVLSWSLLGAWLGFWATVSQNKRASEN